MILSYKNQAIMVDPIFSKQVEDTYKVVQPVRVKNRQRLSDKITAVLISHSHEDHFHLPTLSLLSRDVPIYFPAGEIVIPALLRQLGFLKLKQMRPLEPLLFGELQAIPTPSRVKFPEVGFIFRAGKVCVWNLVDSEVTIADVNLFKLRFGKPTLAFVGYQPLREEGVADLSVLNGPPQALYHEMLALAASTEARWIVPSSWDLKNTVQPWINRYLAPVSKSRFIEDIFRLAKESRGQRLDAGECLDISKDQSFTLSGRTRLGSYGLCKSKADPGKRNNALFPFLDHTKPTESAKKTKQAVLHFLKTDFLKQLRAAASSELIGPYCEHKLAWGLTVKFADQADINLCLDFGKHPLQWSRKDIQVDLQTQVGGRDLLRFAAGELASYLFKYGGYMRVASVNRKGSIFKNAEPLLSIYNRQQAYLRHLRIIKNLLSNQEQY